MYKFTKRYCKIFIPLLLLILTAYYGIIFAIGPSSPAYINDVYKYTNIAIQDFLKWIDTPATSLKHTKLIALCVIFGFGGGSFLLVTPLLWFSKKTGGKVISLVFSIIASIIWAVLIIGLMYSYNLQNHKLFVKNPNWTSMVGFCAATLLLISQIFFIIYASMQNPNIVSSNNQTHPKLSRNQNKMRKLQQQINEIQGSKLNKKEQELNQKINNLKKNIDNFSTIINKQSNNKKPMSNADFSKKVTDEKYKNSGKFVRTLTTKQAAKERKKLKKQKEKIINDTQSTFNNPLEHKSSRSKIHFDGETELISRDKEKARDRAILNRNISRVSIKPKFTKKSTANTANNEQNSIMKDHDRIWDVTKNTRNNYVENMNKEIEKDNVSTPFGPKFDTTVKNKKHKWDTSKSIYNKPKN